MANIRQRIGRRGVVLSQSGVTLVDNGHQVVVETDYNPLQHFVAQPNLNARQRRWSNAFADFNFVIRYKPGVANVVADQLSRLATTLPVSTSLTPPVSIAAVAMTASPSDTLAERPFLWTLGFRGSCPILTSPENSR